jgi:hypothetical protein
MEHKDVNRKHVETGMSQYGSYMLAQARELKEMPVRPFRPGPAVTVSYQTGAGEHEIASRVAGVLQETESMDTAPWTVFDRQLVEQALREHQFPETMAKFIAEDHRNFVEEEIRDILGLHPPAWVIVPQIAETVLRLANAGHVVLVGRGAVFITSKVPNVFHVRLVAPLPNRIDRVRMTENLSEKAAAKYITKNDRGRNRYLKAYFHGRQDDDLLYDMVINTGRIPYIEAAQLIAKQAHERFQSGTDNNN